MDNLTKYSVKITEISEMIVEIEAKSKQEAEQIVCDKWENSEYILDSSNFCTVEFTTIEE